MDNLLEINSAVYYEPKRFESLNISAEDFLTGYNLDVTPYIVRHRFKEKAQKGGAVINYLPYSHAVREMRKLHPKLEACCLVNPTTGGYVFKELDSGGYLLKPYLTDGIARSEIYNFSILSSSGGPVSAVSPDAKSYNSQVINKHYYRAITKAIALVTGIGLKLWTLEDLDDEIIDATMASISRIKELSVQYRMATGKVYDLPELTYMTPQIELLAIGKALAKAVKEVEPKK